MGELRELLAPVENASEDDPVALVTALVVGYGAEGETERLDELVPVTMIVVISVVSRVFVKAGLDVAAELLEDPLTGAVSDRLDEVVAVTMTVVLGTVIVT